MLLARARWRRLNPTCSGIQGTPHRTLARAPLLKRALTAHRYGIHGVEMLFTAMGHGCTTVARTSTKDTDVCVGTWGDGRVGTFRGMRNVSAYGGYAYGSKGVNELGGSPGYGVMLEAILEFFRCANATLDFKALARSPPQSHTIIFGAAGLTSPRFPTRRRLISTPL